MENAALSELLEVTNRRGLAEVGGGHNQKGVEFQKHWAIWKMVEMERGGATDFLFLFEAIQDVSIVDSCESPTSICIYQIKKKDRNEWAWTDLTSLHHPPDPSKPKPKAKLKPLEEVKGSPLGKLYSTVKAFEALTSTGRFVSNAGCDLPLEDGTNAATSMPVPLSALTAHYRDLISSALESLHKKGDQPPDLAQVYLEKVPIPVDDPGTHVIGFVHKFLNERCPRHAAQAESLVVSLLAKIGPLGAKTDSCKSFAEVRRERGYSRDELLAALGDLEQVPDFLDHLKRWLDKLSQEKMGLMEITAIDASAAGIFRRQVMGVGSVEADAIASACDNWISDNGDPINLKDYLEEAYQKLHPMFPSMKKAEVFAHLALRAIRKCADQT